MRGLDDGPDGLNEEAFDRALRSAPSPRKRQAIPVLADVAPSAQLSQATEAVEPIEFETKSTQSAELYRWCCTACGRKGAWLERPEVVRHNASAHAQYHSEGCP